MAVTSLAAFPSPPCLPRWGNSRPPPHQEVGRRRARAFLCSSPVTPPASFLPHSGKGVAVPFLCPRARHRPWLSLARCFISRPHVLSFSVHRLPLLRSTDMFGMRQALQSPGSRRGVAPCRLGAPPAASISPALPAVAVVRQGRAALRFALPFRPPGFPRPSAPRGSRYCLRARPDDRFAATGPPLRHFVLFLCPVPADLTARLPVLGRCGRLRDRIKPADAPLGRFCLVLRAVGRQALRADCLGPSAFLKFIARSRRDLAALGHVWISPFSSSPAPHRKTTDAAPPALWWPARPPVTSFVGDRRPRAISFFSVVVTRPPLCSGRDTSP